MWLQRYGFEAVLVLTWRLESGRSQGLGRVIAALATWSRDSARRTHRLEPQHDALYVHCTRLRHHNLARRVMLYSFESRD